jgi:hypothetical protein
MCLRERLQVFHLIGEDVPIGKNEFLAFHWSVRHVEQTYACLLGRATGFGKIAIATGRDAVFPCVFAVLRAGNDVIAREFGFRKLVAAIGAEMPISREQQSVVASRQCRNGTPCAVFVFAFACDDRIDFDDAAFTVFALNAAAKGKDHLAERPDDAASRVLANGIFRSHPTLRLTSGIKSQDR